MTDVDPLLSATEACKRRSFPQSWLLTGVVWSEYTDHSRDGNQGASA